MKSVIFGLGVESDPLSIDFDSDGNAWLASYKSSNGNTTLIKYSLANDTYTFYEYSSSFGQIKSFQVQTSSSDPYLLILFYNSSSNTEGKKK